MRRTHDLDAKDQQILALLEEDARRSNSEIARLTELSAPTVADRIARLRDIGVIRGFSVRINESRVGLPVSAIIEFRPYSLRDNEATQLMARYPQIRDCYRVTGNALLVMIARVASNEALESLLADLYKHGEPRTSVILSTDFAHRPLFANAL